MPDKFDLSQTVVAWAFAAARAENVWGDAVQITRFFDMALREGGTWSGRYPKEDSPVANHTVNGFLSAVGGKLIGGDWQIPWGPCVFKDLAKNCLANGMFLACSPRENLYVVSTSPTNFVSPLALDHEDLGTSPEHMADFPVILNTGSIWPTFAGNHVDRPQLTGGIALGINILCTRMHDARGRTLLDYLKIAEKDSRTRLIFTGHSLAASLAPVLALQLRDDLERAGWNPANIWTCPIAGVTPGNKKFVDLWADVFREVPVSLPMNPGNAHTSFNVLYRNLLDSVPYSWRNLLGPGGLYWNQYDPQHKDRAVTKIGTCVDNFLILVNDTYETHQNWASQCQLDKLRNASFTGSWPVNYWDANGNRATYPGPRASTIQNPLSIDEYNQALSLTHVVHYLRNAGIDPWEIPTAVSPT